jgi:hypothetical protein
MVEQIEVPESVTSPTYEIQKGDTLTSILKEQIPGIKELGSGPTQDTAIANILKGLSSEDLKAIGVESENVNKIFAGKSLNLEALHKIIEARNVLKQ